MLKQLDPQYRRASLARRTVGVSSPEESHPRALAEPDVNLSAHPAPIIEPQLQNRLANAQKDWAVGARGAQPIGAPGVDRAAF